MRITIDNYDLKIEAINTGGKVFDTYEFSLPEELRKPDTRPTEAVEMPVAEAETEAEGETEASAATTPSTTP